MNNEPFRASGVSSSDTPREGEGDHGIRSEPFRYSERLNVGLPNGSAAVLVSADSPELLRAEASAMYEYLRNHPDVTPEQVAHMLLRTRRARRPRALIAAGGHDQLLDAVKSISTDTTHPAVTMGSAVPRRTAFVFPGQRAQQAGMARSLYESSPVFGATVDETCAIFADLFDGWSPREFLLCHDASSDGNLPDMQAGLFVVMLGLAAMWQAAGVHPGATVGHSQGEIAAAYVAGAISLHDAVLVIAARARAVESLGLSGYSMAVLAMDRDRCEDRIARLPGWVEVAVVNSPRIVTVSGDTDAVRTLLVEVRDAGVFARELEVGHPAAHTSLVSGTQARLTEALTDRLESVAFADSRIPWYGGTFGATVDPGHDQCEYWFFNVRNRVRFDRAVTAAADAGTTTFIEISEHPTLAPALQENLTGRSDDMLVLPTMRHDDELGEFARNVARVAVADLDQPWESLRTMLPRDRLPLRDFPHSRMRMQRLWEPTSGQGRSPSRNSGRRAGNPDAREVLVPAQPTPSPRHSLSSTLRTSRCAVVLVEEWTRLQHRTLVPARRVLPIDPTGRCTDLVAALRVAADRHGAHILTPDPAHESAGTETDTLLVVLPPIPNDVEAVSAALTTVFTDPVRSFLPGNVGQCWLVTSGGESVRPDDPTPGLFSGAVAAGFRCLAAEHPTVRFRHLDLPVHYSPELVAPAVIGAIHSDGEAELAVRDGKLHAKRLRVDDPDTTASPGTPLPVDLAHVLIIGGTGTLGLRFAEHLAEHGAKRVTLLSRSGEQAALTGRLREIRGRGTDIDVVACDCADSSAMGAIASDLSPVTMLINAAVTYVRAESGEVTAAKVAESVRAKLVGTRVAVAVLPLAPNCRVLLCSSLAATIGGRGQMLYATANRMLDILARQLRSDGIDAVSVQWGLWDIPGPLYAVDADTMQVAGVVAMSPEDGLRLGFTEFAERTDRIGNRLIAAADWGRLATLLAAVDRNLLPAELTMSTTAVTVGPPTPERIPAIVAEVMGLPDASAIDTSSPLVSLGLDSVQALDLFQRAKTDLNLEVDLETVLAGASLDELVQLYA